MSGPARARSVAAPAAAGHRPSLAARGLWVIRGLPEHTLLDRIVRGRAWIPLLGVLLVGIVAMQVEILKLGTGMGRWIDRSSTLSTKNQALQASVAGLMDDQRIERLAAKMGMVMPDPTGVSFLSAQPGAARAVANIHAPDSSTFSAQPASQVATASSLADSASAAGGTTGGAAAPLDTSSSASTSTGAGGDAATGTGSGGDAATGTGSGGAASIAPASSQPSGSNGG